MKRPETRANGFDWRDHPREWVSRYPAPLSKRLPSDVSPHSLKIFKYPHLLCERPQSVNHSGNRLRVVVFKYL